MSLVATKRTGAAVALIERTRGYLSPLNLHFAGLGLLALVNLYLLVHMAFLWQAASSRNAAALDQQALLMRTAQFAVEPLRGLDVKLDQATAEADNFYAKRLPGSDSAVAAELGTLTKAHAVKLVRVQYTHAPALVGTAGELTEVHMDASLSGDYRPLVQFINALERDKMFFVIYGVTLTGQQSGTVNLRLRLTTYLRGHAPEDLPPAQEIETSDATPAATGGAQ